MLTEFLFNPMRMNGEPNMVAIGIYFLITLVIVFKYLDYKRG